MASLVFVLIQFLLQLALQSKSDRMLMVLFITILFVSSQSINVEVLFNITPSSDNIAMSYKSIPLALGPNISLLSTQKRSTQCTVFCIYISKRRLNL